MSPLRWTTKSTRALAAELTRSGHKVSAHTVVDLLRQEGFSLRADAKTIEGRQHPNRVRLQWLLFVVGGCPRWTACRRMR